MLIVIYCWMFRLLIGSDLFPIEYKYDQQQGSIYLPNNGTDSQAHSDYDQLYQVAIKYMAELDRLDVI